MIPTLRTPIARGLRRIGPLAAGALLVAARSASAQLPPVPAGPAIGQPPALTTPTVSLAEAVRLTIANNPQIKFATENVRSSAGQLQQSTGAFDWTLHLTPAFTYNNAALAPSVRTNEYNRRLKLQATATAFGIVNRALLDSLKTLGPRPPRCPLQFASTSDVINDQVDPLAITFPDLKGFENTRFTFDGPIRDTLQQFKNSGVCGPADDIGSTTGLMLTELQKIQNTTFRALAGSGLVEATVTLEQAPNEIVAVTQQIAQAAATQASNALGRLGVVPRDEVVTSGTLDTSFGRLFRNGMSGSFNLHFLTSADNFKDKSLDPNFGGLGRPIKFAGSVFGTLTFPLARGLGIATSAPERAARLTLSADTDQLRQSTSEEALRTVLAYLQLVGAQQNVQSLEESATRQGQINNLTQLRVNSGDVPAVELQRTQARAASVRTALSQARQAVIDARMSLAEAMGIDVATMANAPLAADTFAESLGTLPDVKAMIPLALSTRPDVRALTSLTNAARLLEQGAFASARPRLDLSLKAGMSSFYDDLTFYTLPDEVNPIFTELEQPAPPQPSTGAVPFGSLTGFYRAFVDRQWRPLFSVNLVLNLPWRNNALRGRAAQAESSRARSEVQQQDLTRVIQENVVGEVGALRREAAAIERQQAAVQSSQQTLDAELQRFQQGDVTLIDTLLTEENLTNDRLSLVNLWQQYLAQVARLKFETGTLVSFNGPDITPDQVRFDPTQFVRR
ncbi:MAG: TolC family protein [Betaproteobacteria bacterium]